MPLLSELDSSDSSYIDPSLLPEGYQSRRSQLSASTNEDEPDDAPVEKDPFVREMSSLLTNNYYAGSAPEEKTRINDENFVLWKSSKDMDKENATVLAKVKDRSDALNNDPSAEVEKDVPMYGPDGNLTHNGEERVQRAKDFLEAAASMPNGGVLKDQRGRLSVDPQLIERLRDGGLKAPPPLFPKLDEFRKSLEEQKFETGKAGEDGWVNYANWVNSKTANEAAHLDVGNKRMMNAYENNLALSRFNPDAMEADQPVALVGGSVVFNSNQITNLAAMEKGIDGLPISESNKEMARVSLRKKVNSMGEAVRSAGLAELNNTLPVVGPLIAGYGNIVKGIVGMEQNDIQSKYERFAADPKKDLYSFIQENPEVFSNDSYGVTSKFNNAFWSAQRATGTGALVLVSGAAKLVSGATGVGEGVADSMARGSTAIASASSEADDLAWNMMSGGSTTYNPVGNIKFTNKSLYDMAGQVAGMFGTAGASALLKGGVKALGAATLEATGSAAATAAAAKSIGAGALRIGAQSIAGTAGAIGGGEMGRYVGEKVGGDTGGNIGGVIGGLAGGLVGAKGVSKAQGSNALSRAADAVKESEARMAAYSAELAGTPLTGAAAEIYGGKVAARNGALKFATKMLTDPSAYIGSAQAAGMTFGSTFNQELERTGDYDASYKQAIIKGTADAMSAFIATAVMNRIHHGAEGLMGGQKGAMENSMSWRSMIEARSKGVAGRKAFVGVVNELIENSKLKKDLIKGIIGSMNQVARDAGLRGFAKKALTAPLVEGVEETIDPAISDALSLWMDDSKTWNDEVWNHLGDKMSEYISSGIVGAFGGAGSSTAMSVGKGAMNALSSKSRAEEASIRQQAIRENVSGKWDILKTKVSQAFDPEVQQTMVKSGMSEEDVSAATQLAAYIADESVSTKDKVSKLMGLAKVTQFETEDVSSSPGSSIPSSPERVVMGGTESNEEKLNHLLGEAAVDQRWNKESAASLKEGTKGEKNANGDTVYPVTMGDNNAVIGLKVVRKDGTTELVRSSDPNLGSVLEGVKSKVAKNLKADLQVTADNLDVFRGQHLENQIDLDGAPSFDEAAPAGDSSVQGSPDSETTPAGNVADNAPKVWANGAMVSYTNSKGEVVTGEVLSQFKGSDDVNIKLADNSTRKVPATALQEITVESTPPPDASVSPTNDGDNSPQTPNNEPNKPNESTEKGSEEDSNQSDPEDAQGVRGQQEGYGDGQEGRNDDGQKEDVLTPEAGEVDASSAPAESDAESAAAFLTPEQARRAEFEALKAGKPPVGNSPARSANAKPSDKNTPRSKAYAGVKSTISEKSDVSKNPGQTGWSKTSDGIFQFIANKGKKWTPTLGRMVGLEGSPDSVLFMKSSRKNQSGQWVYEFVKMDVTKAIDFDSAISERATRLNKSWNDTRLQKVGQAILPHLDNIVSGEWLNDLNNENLSDAKRKAINAEIKKLLNKVFGLISNVDPKLVSQVEGGNFMRAVHKFSVNQALIMVADTTQEPVDGKYPQREETFEEWDKRTAATSSIEVDYKGLLQELHNNFNEMKDSLSGKGNRSMGALEIGRALTAFADEEVNHLTFFDTVSVKEAVDSFDEVEKFTANDGDAAVIMRDMQRDLLVERGKSGSLSEQDKYEITAELFRKWGQLMHSGSTTEQQLANARELVAAMKADHESTSGLGKVFALIKRYLEKMRQVRLFNFLAGQLPQNQRRMLESLNRANFERGNNGDVDNIRTKVAEDQIKEGRNFFSQMQKENSTAAAENSDGVNALRSLFKGKEKVFDNLSVNDVVEIDRAITTDANGKAVRPSYHLKLKPEFREYLAKMMPEKLGPIESALQGLSESENVFNVFTDIINKDLALKAAERALDDNPSELLGKNRLEQLALLVADQGTQPNVFRAIDLQIDQLKSRRDTILDMANAEVIHHLEQLDVSKPSDRASLLEFAYKLQTHERKDLIYQKKAFKPSDKRLPEISAALESNEAQADYLGGFDGEMLRSNLDFDGFQQLLNDTIRRANALTSLSNPLTEVSLAGLATGSPFASNGFYYRDPKILSNSTFFVANPLDEVAVLNQSIKDQFEERRQLVDLMSESEENDSPAYHLAQAERYTQAAKQTDDMDDKARNKAMARMHASRASADMTEVNRKMDQFNTWFNAQEAYNQSVQKATDRILGDFGQNKAGFGMEWLPIHVDEVDTTSTVLPKLKADEVKKRFLRLNGRTGTPEELRAAKKEYEAADGKKQEADRQQKGSNQLTRPSGLIDVLGWDFSNNRPSSKDEVSNRVVASNASFIGSETFAHLYLKLVTGRLTGKDAGVIRSGGFSHPLDDDGNQLQLSAEKILPSYANQLRSLRDLQQSLSGLEANTKNNKAFREMIGDADQRGTYREQLDRLGGWLSTLETTFGETVDEVDGQQTLAGRYKPLVQSLIDTLSQSLEAQTKLFETFKNARLVGQLSEQDMAGFKSIINQNINNTPTSFELLEQGYNLNFVVKQARSSYLRFNDAIAQENIRKEADRSSREKGYVGGRKMFRSLYDSNIDLRILTNQTFNMDYFDQSGRAKILSGTMAVDLLDRINKSNYSKDERQKWVQLEKVKWMAKQYLRNENNLRVDEDGLEIADNEDFSATGKPPVLAPAEQSVGRVADEALVQEFRALDDEGRFTSAFASGSSPYSITDETYRSRSQNENEVESPLRIWKRAYTQAAMFIGHTQGSEAARAFVFDLEAEPTIEGVASLVQRGISGLFDNDLMQSVMNGKISPETDALIQEFLEAHPEFDMAKTLREGVTNSKGKRSRIADLSFDSGNFVRSLLEFKISKDQERIMAAREKSNDLTSQAIDALKSLKSSKGSIQSAFTSKADVNTILKQLEKDATGNSAVPILDAALVHRSDVAFIESHPVLSSLIQAIPNTFIYQPGYQQLGEEARNLGIHLIVGGEGKPNLLFVPAGKTIGRDNATRLIAQSLELLSKNPSLNEAILSQAAHITESLKPANLPSRTEVESYAKAIDQLIAESKKWTGMDAAIGNRFGDAGKKAFRELLGQHLDQSGEIAQLLHDHKNLVEYFSPANGLKNNENLLTSSILLISEVLGNPEALNLYSLTALESNPFDEQVTPELFNRSVNLVNSLKQVNLMGGLAGEIALERAVDEVPEGDDEIGLQNSIKEFTPVEMIVAGPTLAFDVEQFKEAVRRTPEINSEMLQSIIAQSLWQTGDANMPAGYPALYEEVMNSQLSQGGLRLAMFLSSVLASNTSEPVMDAGISGREYARQLGLQEVINRPAGSNFENYTGSWLSMVNPTIGGLMQSTRFFEDKLISRFGSGLFHLAPSITYKLNDLSLSQELLEKAKEQATQRRNENQLNEASGRSNASRSIIGVSGGTIRSELNDALLDELREIFPKGMLDDKLESARADLEGMRNHLKESEELLKQFTEERDTLLQTTLDSTQFKSSDLDDPEVRQRVRQDIIDRLTEVVTGMSEKVDERMREDAVKRLESGRKEIQGLLDRFDALLEKNDSNFGGNKQDAGRVIQFNQKIAALEKGLRKVLGVSIQLPRYEGGYDSSKMRNAFISIEGRINSPEFANDIRESKPIYNEKKLNSEFSGRLAELIQRAEQSAARADQPIRERSRSGTSEEITKLVQFARKNANNPDLVAQQVDQLLETSAPGLLNEVLQSFGLSDESKMMISTAYLTNPDGVENFEDPVYAGNSKMVGRVNELNGNINQLNISIGRIERDLRSIDQKSSASSPMGSTSVGRTGSLDGQEFRYQVRFNQEIAKGKDQSADEFYVRQKALKDAVSDFLRNYAKDTYKRFKGNNDLYTDMDVTRVVAQTIDAVRMEKQVVDGVWDQYDQDLETYAAVLAPENGLEMVKVESGEGNKRIRRLRGVKNVEARKAAIGQLVDTGADKPSLFLPYDAKQRLAAYFQANDIQESVPLALREIILNAAAYKPTAHHAMGFDDAYLQQDFDSNAFSLTKGQKLTRLEAANLFADQFGKQMEMAINSRAKTDGQKVDTAGDYYSKQLSAFSDLIRKMVYAHGHPNLSKDKGDTSELLQKFLTDLESRQFVSPIAGSPFDSLTKMDLLGVYGRTFADIFGEDMVRRMESGLIEVGDNERKMLTHLNHQDARMKRIFMGKWSAYNESIRLISMLETGVDNSSGRNGYLKDIKAAGERLTKAGKEIGNHYEDHGRALLIAQLRGIRDARGQTLSQGFSMWAKSLNQGKMAADYYERDLQKYHKNRFTRWFNAKNHTLMQEQEGAKNLIRLITPTIQGFTRDPYRNNTIEENASQTIDELVKLLQQSPRKDGIMSYADEINRTFKGLADALELTKMVMSEPGKMNEDGSMASMGMDAMSHLYSTVPIKFVHASNPDRSLVKLTDDEQVANVMDMMSIKRSSMYGGAGRAESMQKGYYKVLDLNGITGVNSLLDDTIYRLNVAPSYAVLSQTVGMNRRINDGKPTLVNSLINRNVSTERRAQQEQVLRAVAHEFEQTLTNDSRPGVQNTGFSKAVDRVNGFFVFRALFSVLQVPLQTVPSVIGTVLSKVGTGEHEWASDYIGNIGEVMAAQMGRGLPGSAAKTKANQIDAFIKDCSPQVFYRSSDGMDPIRRAGRSQIRSGKNKLATGTTFAADKLGDLQEGALDWVIAKPERILSRAIWFTSVINQLKESGMSNPPTTINELLNMPTESIPEVIKSHALIQVNTLMGMSDTSKKAKAFQNLTRSPSLNQLIKSVVRFGNHTATTSGNNAVAASILMQRDHLTDSSGNLDSDAMKMRQLATQDLVSAITQNVLFKLMKPRILAPLVGYLGMLLFGDDKDREKKAQRWADQLLQTQQDDGKLTGFVKDSIFGRPQPFFSSKKSAEAARLSAASEVIASILQESISGIPLVPGIGVIAGYTPVTDKARIGSNEVVPRIAAGFSKEKFGGNGVSVLTYRGSFMQSMMDVTPLTSMAYDMEQNAEATYRGAMEPKVTQKELASLWLNEFFGTREGRSTSKKQVRESLPRTKR